MIDNLNQQIDRINQLLDKLPTDQKELAEQRFLQLVEERRKLKTLRDTVADNPGIGIYGVKTAGRGFLTNTLLNLKDCPFMVKDREGNNHDFSHEIRPITELLFTVIRFSSFSNNPELYSNKYPVMVRLLSVADIIMTLSDCYYNNLKDYGKYTLRWSYVEDLTRFYYEYYINKPRIPSPILEADDILRIKDYFQCHISRAANYANSSCTFFDSIAIVIDRIPGSEYARVFSQLWNDDRNISRLFTFLYDILKRFNFAKSIYLPIEAALHQCCKENTILGRESLMEFLWHRKKSKYTTDAYTREGKEFVKCAVNVPKGEICAVTAEVIFKIEDDFLHDKLTYDFTNIADDVRQRLNKENIEKTILNDCDLLYFPINRPRLDNIVDSMETDEILFSIYERGKTAYLFNKFNEEKRINILLYCHHDQQNEVKTMPSLLKEWVHTYVGDTPEKRSSTVAKAEGSPLFYIATMFNKDMKERKNGTDDLNGLNKRWEGRFETVLLYECFGCEEWVNNWTATNRSFKNSYLLRDYQYSENLYDGFRENKIETNMRMDTDYYKLMRKSFISHRAVCKFFDDPALSWDVAATLNNDGSLYIIENLQRVGSRIGKVRENQLIEQIEQAKARIQEYTLLP